MYLDITLLAGFLLIFSCLSGWVKKSWVSGPILYTLFGFTIGPLGADLLSFDINANTIKILAELTLAIVLFTDASAANLSVLKRSSAIPMRMLLIGLPLTLLFGFGVGFSMFDQFSVIEVAILATLLAPTDAALGQAVLQNEAVPNRLRQGLNAESGLNDGICVPILFVFLALAPSAQHSAHGSSEHLALTLLAEELGIGLLVGVLVVIIAYQLLKLAISRNWLNHTWSQLPVVATAITSFALAQQVGGSGFIAAFCGGLLFGHLLNTEKEELLVGAESMGESFSLLTWVLFGAVAFGQSLPMMNFEIICYSILSLTLIRILPIALSLWGSGLDLNEKLFLGWFGPRGLASIVFTIIVLGHQLPNSDTIIAIVSCTVFMSIFLHGVTAKPWARRWENPNQAEKKSGL